MKAKRGSDKVVLWPILLSESVVDGEEARLVARIPDELAYFVGHFDNLAIVPGVVQIQWAVHYARVCLGIEGRFSSMEAIKFKEFMRPGQTLELRLNRAGADRLKFVFCSQDTEYSSGRIYFHD
jgi:3-hydroxymyristoyl/3-hydroxydecanoyl-(acyl carrier protein) dehydratase